ncbi:MAG: hypothetical protein R3F44_09355 [Candidatus Competibacteraceae bacterium]
MHLAISGVLLEVLAVLALPPGQALLLAITCFPAVLASQEIWGKGGTARFSWPGGDRYSDHSGFGGVGIDDGGGHWGRRHCGRC